jgi:hypothetical protein
VIKLSILKLTQVLRQVIIKSGNKYSTIDGLDLCNGGEVATFDNAVVI